MNIKDVFYDFTKMNREEFKQKYSENTNLIYLLYDAADIISNDKNSSMAREYSTLKECSYEQNTNKLDYDGYDSNNNPIEAKPQNYYTNTTSKNPKKLNGCGSYNDYTWERYDKDYENNPEVLFSGFIDGKLLYILSVKYDDIKGITEKLEKRFPNRVRNVGEFIRTIQLSYKNYKDAESLQIKYSDKEKIKKYKKCINKKLYDKLLSE